MHDTVMVDIFKFFLVTSNLLRSGLYTQSETYAAITPANSQMAVKSGDESDSYTMTGQLTTDP